MPDVRGSRTPASMRLSTNPRSRPAILWKTRTARGARGQAPARRSSRSDGSARRRPLPGGRPRSIDVARRRGRPRRSPAGRSAPRARPPRPRAPARERRLRAPRASVSVGPGRTRTNAEPAPGTEATSRSPPIWRARSRAIGRPRPVPVTRSCPTSRWKRSKIRPRSSAGIPSPSSRTIRIGGEPVDAAGDLDAAARRGELQGVRHEVRQDLLDAPPVAGRDPHPRRQGGRQPRPVVDRDRQQARGDLGAGLGDRERPDLEVDRPRLQARQLQQVADEVRHRADDRPAPLEEVVLDRRIEDLAAEDQLEVAAQPGERRPQLVGDGRDEGGPLGVAGAERRRARARAASWFVTRARATPAWRAIVGGRRSASRAASAGAGELEAERDVAGGRDRQHRVMAARAVGCRRRRPAARDAVGLESRASAASSSTRRPPPTMNEIGAGAGGGAPGARAGRVRVEPAGERLGLGRILVGVDRRPPPAARSPSATTATRRAPTVFGRAGAADRRGAPRRCRRRRGRRAPGRGGPSPGGRSGPRRDGTSGAGRRRARARRRSAAAGVSPSWRGSIIESCGDASRPGTSSRPLIGRPPDRRRGCPLRV